MKPTTLTTGRFLLVLLIAGLTVGLVSWDDKQSPGHYGQITNDTTPKKKSVDKDKKIRDLDDVLKELESADWKVDVQKIQEEVRQALKGIDADKLRLEIESAMKEVDITKLKAEIADAMKGIDGAKIQKEVQESLAKVDFNKIKEEIADAMKNLDLSKIQKEVQESLAKVEIKEVDMKKLTEEMKKLGEEMKGLGPKIQKEMEQAKEEIEKAKAEIKEYKAFVDGLENDGLINKKENYTLKHKDGELFINGKKASDQTYSKYRSFLEKHKEFSIKKDDDDFDIDMD